jgi:polyisoprenoid-binding protein YceI
MVGQPSTLPVPAGTAVPAGAEVYEVNAEESEVVMLVYRAGPLARFGHNHAIASTLETGRAWVGDTLDASGFELRVPVAQLSVDDPSLRASLGGEFAGAVPDDAREGTLRNMLRPGVLDAEHHPEIRVQSIRISGDFGQPLVRAAVTLRGLTREIEVPVELQRDSARIEASGSMKLRQTEFGITPFSIAGGAVQVADEIDVRFRIVAAR